MSLPYFFITKNNKVIFLLLLFFYLREFQHRSTAQEKNGNMLLERIFIYCPECVGLILGVDINSYLC